MAKTELKLKSKNQATDQTITTTIGYVNPSADSNTLKTFGQKLNAFTTNNYVETDRQQTINVDTEQIPVSVDDLVAIPYNITEGSTNLIINNTDSFLKVTLPSDFQGNTAFKTNNNSSTNYLAFTTETGSNKTTTIKAVGTTTGIATMYMIPSATLSRKYKVTELTITVTEN